jgi:elongation factor Tu
MVVTDCFVIARRGLVATGTIETGTVEVGERVTVERAGESFGTLEIGAIEHARKVVRRAAAGQAVGLLFRGVSDNAIVPGDVLRATPS